MTFVISSQFMTCDCLNLQRRIEKLAGHDFIANRRTPEQCYTDDKSQ